MPHPVMRLSILFALLIASLMPAAQAQIVPASAFPPLTGRVVDQADLLTPEQEQQITTQSDALEKASGRQFVVATISDLKGYEVRDYGYQLGRHWGIGTKENDGVILLVAPNERKVAIEVGYGLEPILTDALSSLIINQQILPHFKAGDMPGGIVSGAYAIMEQIGLPTDQAATRQQQLLAADKEARRDSGGSPLILLFWLIVVAMIVLPTLFNAVRGGRGSRYRGGRGPVVIWGPSSGGWSSSSSSDSWSSGSSGGSSWGGGGGGFSGGGGSFGGGGASGSW
ncbi:TPM domain-containing protein [Sphingomonas colocasiae]|uniref:TPM domain-containing protein n=2 Tax=Sphingomonas colocasiae TaxID=1848973 RepID=A0ABS7PL33_9SPHN|nr:TPM domain-containing protein [Sphingomonas colocasiae]